MKLELNLHEFCQLQYHVHFADGNPMEFESTGFPSDLPFIDSVIFVIFMKSELLYLPRESFSARYGATFFTYELLGYHMVGGPCCNPSHIEYEIKVIRANRNWIVHRRFREFYELGQFFRQSMNISTPLPRRTLCTPSISDEEFLDKRKEELDTFLDELLRELAITTGRNIMSMKDILEFFRLVEPNKVD